MEEFQAFWDSFLAFWSDPLFKPSGSEGKGITPLNILGALLTLFIAKRVIGFFNGRILKRVFDKRNIDVGRQYTITRLVLYVGFTIAILSAMQILGFNPTILLGAGAALLVGIGLGLQQTFNDFFSGLILLFEGSVQVGDVLILENKVGKVLEIGMRTSKLETRDNVSVIVPNSKLVTDIVTNWSNNEGPTRFSVTVGVAYGSDVRTVEKLLLQAATDHTKVLSKPPPKVVFNDFGNSSLDFILYYHSFAFVEAEFVKSDLRFRIDQLFRDNGIVIPFPQQDVWLRTPPPSKL